MWMFFAVPFETSMTIFGSLPTVTVTVHVCVCVEDINYIKPVQPVEQGSSSLET